MISFLLFGTDFLKKFLGFSKYIFLGYTELYPHSIREEDSAPSSQDLQRDPNMHCVLGS